jgi:hypothetical protein
VSNGRVAYVLGLGYREEEYALYGHTLGERGRLADEKLQVLLDALAGAPVGLGQAVTPGPRGGNRPRISWGGQSVAAARRAGRFGLDFLAQSDGAGLLEAYRDECARHGREPGNVTLPDPTVPVTTFVADDVDRAWEELGPHLLHDATTYASWNPRGREERTASLSFASNVDELRAEQGSYRIFTVDEAVGHLQQHGILPLHPLCGGVPPEVAWPYLQRVVDDVLPRAAAAAG